MCFLTGLIFLEKAQKVFEFMQEAGWINNSNHTVAQHLPDAPDTKSQTGNNSQQPQQPQQQPQQPQDKQLHIHAEQNQTAAFFFVPNSPSLPIFHLHNQKYSLSKSATTAANGGWQNNNNSRMA